MFDGIKNFLREFRIRADFPKYESARLQAYATEAERRFETAQLEKEVESIKEMACQAVTKRFGAEATALNEDIAALEKDIQRTRAYIAIFERDYKRELSELHSSKEALFEEKSRLSESLSALRKERSEKQESLRDSYDRIAAAKNDIDRWHRKSTRTPWLFGNGSRRLPEVSLFGQSFGDLDGYKRDRSSAASDIKDRKERISNLKFLQGHYKEKMENNKTAIANIFDRINATKAARQQMYDLKQRGMKCSALKMELSDQLSLRSTRQDRLRAIAIERVALGDKIKFDWGIRALVVKINEIRAQRAQFMNDFHSPANQALRLEEHRIKWRREHGAD